MKALDSPACGAASDAPQVEMKLQATSRPDFSSQKSKSDHKEFAVRLATGGRACSSLTDCVMLMSTLKIQDVTTISTLVADNYQ